MKIQKAGMIAEMSPFPAQRQGRGDVHHLQVPEEPMPSYLCPSTWHRRFVLVAKPRLNTAVSLREDFEFKGTQASHNWGLFYYY